MNVVLIEDEPECYESFQVMLESRSHKVTVYHEADNVITNINNICSADVIVLDLMIQLGTIIKSNEATETGIAIYKRIRKINTKIPIVVLTARSQSEIWSDFNQDKFIHYIGKPISNVNVFYKLIEEWN